MQLLLFFNLFFKLPSINFNNYLIYNVDIVLHDPFQTGYFFCTNTPMHLIPETQAGG